MLVRAMLVSCVIGLCAAQSVLGAAHVRSGDCFVAELTVVWDDVPDYRIHRVVVAGIRRFDAVADSASGTCRPTDQASLADLRRAVDARLDSIRVVRPLTRTFVHLRHASLDVVRAELARIASRAREHAGSFRHVELVPAPAPGAPMAGLLPLPRFGVNDEAVAACTADNARLAREQAAFRWAC